MRLQNGGHYVVGIGDKVIKTGKLFELNDVDRAKDDIPDEALFEIEYKTNVINPRAGKVFEDVPSISVFIGETKAPDFYEGNYIYIIGQNK